MPPEARRRLLELAEEHDHAIIEDDIYADTGWLGVPNTLKALDQTGRVIHSR